MSWIMTYTGTQFDLADPKPNQVKLVDIAHSLSLICRFTGHTEYLYSVAQHCLLGTYLMKEEGFSERIQLLFLLHDAIETWYTDVNKPLKSLLSEYVTLEENAHMVVWKAFGITPPTDEEWEAVQYMDYKMLRIEVTQLMPRPELFGVQLLHGMPPITPELPKEVEKVFTETLIGLLQKEGIVWQES